MQKSLKNSLAARWMVPVGAVAMVGGAIGAAPMIAAAQGDPSLPPKTAAQLLVAAEQAKQLSHPLSGTIVENASLGLPPLPDNGDNGSPVSLLSGSHTARIWYGDPQHVRLAQITPGSEQDYIRNGAQTWEWSSAKNTATRGTIDEKQQPQRPMPRASLTPQEAADRALAAVGKTTAVSVDPTGRVAGREAYELVLSPKDARSLVGQVRVALDGKTFVPLRVQVFPKGSATPAAQVGFTSLTYTKPAAANFDFKPPPGAKVVQRSDQAKATPQRPGQQPMPKKIGNSWTTVVQLSLPKNATKDGMSASLIRSMTPVQGGRVLRTKLFSVLLTDDGRLFAGAVTPDVLTQAAR